MEVMYSLIMASRIRRNSPFCLFLSGFMLRFKLKVERMSDRGTVHRGFTEDEPPSQRKINCPSGLFVSTLFVADSDSGEFWCEGWSCAH